MRLYVILFSLLLQSTAFAGFGIAKGASAPPPDDGFSKTAPYDDAVNNRTILSPAEQREIKSMVKRPINNAYYFRTQLMLNGKTKVSGMTQYASVDYPDIDKKGTGDTVTLTSVEKKAKVFGLAMGYKGTDWRYELEFYNPATLDYLAEPVITTANPDSGNLTNFNSQISSKLIAFNMLRDLPKVFYLSPYLGGGLGLSYQSMKTTATDADTDEVLESKSNHNILPALNGTVGVRARVLEMLWLDAGYRYWYIYQGARANVAGVSLKGTSETISGPFFGLNYQF